MFSSVFNESLIEYQGIFYTACGVNSRAHIASGMGNGALGNNILNSNETMMGLEYRSLQIPVFSRMDNALFSSSPIRVVCNP